MNKPEAASVWHERKTTTPSSSLTHKKTNNEAADLLSLVDNEVERDPKEWEIKMRQLSKELSGILHRLKVGFLG